MRTRLQFCRTCAGKRTFEKTVVRHDIHLLLTVLSLGLWGFCWLLISIKSFATPWRCRKCRVLKESGDTTALIAARKIAPDGFGDP